MTNTQRYVFALCGVFFMIICILVYLGHPILAVIILIPFYLSHLVNEMLEREQFK